MSNTNIGGWTAFAKPTALELEVFNEAMKGLIGVKYTPETVSSQVVEGMNYKFKCEGLPAALKPVSFQAMIQIYAPIGGTPVITHINPIKDPDAQGSVYVNAERNNVIGKNGAQAGTFVAGQVITISCDPADKWNINTGNGVSRCNANGFNNLPVAPPNFGQTFLAGCVVGSFDGGNTFFSVGTKTEITICAAMPGTDSVDLTLYCWDSFHTDNEGEISVSVATM
jgi:hypothetical protein